MRRRCGRAAAAIVASRGSDVAGRRARRRPRDRRRAARARQRAALRRRPARHRRSGARRRRLGPGRPDQHGARRGDRRRRRTAVGLTGADAANRAVDAGAGTFTTVSGETVDLGLVGSPTAPTRRCWPTCSRSATSRSSRASASTREGTLLNVNADTLAGASGGGARRRPADRSPARPPACSTTRASRLPALTLAGHRSR